MRFWRQRHLFFAELSRLGGLLFFALFGIILSSAVTSPAEARSLFQDNRIYAMSDVKATSRGRSVPETSLSAVIAGLRPGQLFVIGEVRGMAAHLQQQREIWVQIERLWSSASRPPAPLLGMADLTADVQAALDAWTNASLDEVQLKASLGWTEADWATRRDLFAFVRAYRGRILALAPDRLWIGRVRTVGLSGLTAAESALLPNGFQLGDALYRERYMRSITGHVANPSAAENYFIAQSAIDDIAAARMSDELRRSPESIALLVFNELSTRYSGGVVGRFRARVSAPVISLSQLDLTGLTPRERETEVRPHGRYGDRADFVWVTR
jgi:uncharacterized iron-regulated protein